MSEPRDDHEPNPIDLDRDFPLPYERYLEEQADRAAYQRAYEGEHAYSCPDCDAHFRSDETGDVVCPACGSHFAP